MMLHLLYFVFVSVFTCDLSAAPAIIDFLDDDIPYETYSALNYVQSPENVTTADWTLLNRSGQAYRSGQFLYLANIDDIIYQSINLIAGEPYFMTFTGSGSTGDLVRFQLLTSDSEVIEYEYLSLRDEVDSYPIRITVPQSGQYRVQLRTFPGYDASLIDWGTLGVYPESSLIDAGADWATFSVWTDSMGANATYGWPQQLKALIDAPTYIDGAVGGQKSTEILQRVLLASEFGDLAIIWAGNNNPWPVATVLADIEQIVATLPHSNYFVISLHNNASQDSSSTTYNNVIEINTQLASTYGNRFVDTRSFLISNPDLNDPGDLADASAGIVPRSFRVDGIHLNVKGQRYVASILSNRINAFGSDGDGITNNLDNCTVIANADQRDTNGDGYGNICDGDLNNDGSTNALDLNLYKLAHRSAVGDASYNVDADFNGDGAINTLDLNIYKGLHRKPPGPSCCAP